MTTKVVKMYPVRQDKFTPMNFKSFYWMIYSQFCRPEMGISHQELKNPDQMRKDVCDHFFKKHQEGDPYVHRIINEKIKKGEIENVGAFYMAQRLGKAPVCSPIIECFANLKNIDIVILDIGENDRKIACTKINSTLTAESTSKIPPLIAGRWNGQYQSFIPLDFAGPKLDQLKDWEGKDTNTLDETPLPGIAQSCGDTNTKPMTSPQPATSPATGISTPAPSGKLIS